MVASVRKVRDHLSKYLRRVQQGEEVVITSHNRPIAKLVPLSGEEDDESLFQGIQDLHSELNGEISGAPLSRVVVEMREDERL